MTEDDNHLQNPIDTLKAQLQKVFDRAEPQDKEVILNIYGKPLKLFRPKNIDHENYKHYWRFVHYPDRSSTFPHKWPTNKEHKTCEEASNCKFIQLKSDQWNWNLNFRGEYFVNRYDLTDGDMKAVLKILSLNDESRDALINELHGALNSETLERQTRIWKGATFNSCNVFVMRPEKNRFPNMQNYVRVEQQGSIYCKELSFPLNDDIENTSASLLNLDESEHENEAPFIKLGTQIYMHANTITHEMEDEVVTMFLNNRQEMFENIAKGLFRHMVAPTNYPTPSPETKNQAAMKRVRASQGGITRTRTATAKSQPLLLTHQETSAEKASRVEKERLASQFPLGGRVTIQGLKNFQKLNNTSGTVVDYRNDRIVIGIDQGGRTVNVKPENLTNQNRLVHIHDSKRIGTLISVGNTVSPEPRSGTTGIFRKHEDWSNPLPEARVRLGPDEEDIEVGPGQWSFIGLLPISPDEAVQAAPVVVGWPRKEDTPPTQFGLITRLHPTDEGQVGIRPETQAGVFESRETFEPIENLIYSRPRNNLCEIKCFRSPKLSHSSDLGKATCTKRNMHGLDNEVTGTTCNGYGKDPNPFNL